MRSTLAISALLARSIIVPVVARRDVLRARARIVAFNGDCCFTSFRQRTAVFTGPRGGSRQTIRLAHGQDRGRGGVSIRASVVTPVTGR
jgi:hypothetical protein